MTGLLMRPNPTAVLWGAVVLTIALLGAVVGLDVTGNQDGVGSLLAVGVPFVSALFIAAKVDAVTIGQNDQLAQHTQQLATITRQTNGVLDQRIKDGVAAVLNAAGLIQVAPQPLPLVVNPVPVDVTPAPAVPVPVVVAAPPAAPPVPLA